jgi:hypothetical protein
VKCRNAIPKAARSGAGGNTSYKIGGDAVGENGKKEASKEKKRPALSSKERLFCHFVAELGNIREAAARAGYGSLLAGIRAAELLERPEIRREIARRRKWRGARETVETAIAGLTRIALGENNDGAGLAFAEEAPDKEALAGLDLFGVAEVKRQKGGVEVRFYDRLKALEALLAWGKSQGGESAGKRDLYAALEKSAAALRDRDD